MFGNILIITDHEFAGYNKMENETAICMICEKEFPLDRMDHVPALGYICKDNPECKRKEHILVEVKRMMEDPKYKHMFKTCSCDKETSAKLLELREWCWKNNTFPLKELGISLMTFDGGWVNVIALFKEVDRLFPDWDKQP